MWFPFKFKIVGVEQLWTLFDFLIHADEYKTKEEQDRK